MPFTINPQTGKLDYYIKTRPAGIDTQVQFNQAGVFGGGNLYWDYTNHRLGVGMPSPQGPIDIGKPQYYTISAPIVFDNLIIQVPNGYYLDTEEYFEFRVYSYIDTIYGRVYSPDYIIVSAAGGSSYDPAYLTASWDAVSGATGYRVVVVQDPQFGAFGDYYFDTTYTYFVLGENIAAGYDDVSGQSYQYASPPVVTPTTLRGADVSVLYLNSLGTTLTYTGTTVAMASAAVTASSFTGNGAGLTNLNANNISTGTLAIARGGTNQTSFTNTRLTYFNGTSLTDSANMTYDGTRVQFLGTSDILRVGYNATNYFKFTNSSVGLGILDVVGTTPTFRLYIGGTKHLHFYKPASNDGRNIFLGEDSGNFTMGGVVNSYDGSNNAGIGYATLTQLTSGNGNMAIGTNSLRYLTTGYGNMGIGVSAMGHTSVTSATNCVAVGASALFMNNQVGPIGIGTNALSSSTGTGNVGIGYNVGYNLVAGVQNVLIGEGAEGGATGFSGNVSIGYQTAYETSGSGNVVIGWNAAQTLSTGVSNVIIGYGAGYVGGTKAGVSNHVWIGRETGASATASQVGTIFLGYRAGYRETGSNTLIIDNQDRGSEALNRTGALLYGIFNASVGSQTLTVNAKFNVQGNYYMHNLVTKTTDYTTLISDEIILGNSASPITITLITAVGNTGLQYTIKNINTGQVTIDGNTTQTIDGQLTQGLNQYESLTIVSDGSNWHII
jgi:hypothetical protein